MNVMSMVAMMASPYIVYSVRFQLLFQVDLFYIFKSVLSEKAPFLIIGMISLLGAFPGLLLPETVDVKLPDTLEDMEQFGK